MKIKIVSKFQAIEETDEKTLASLVQYRDENAEDAEFKEVVAEVKPFVAAFKSFGETANKAATAFTKQVAPLAQAIVARIAAWKKTGKTNDQAARIVRKHTTVALVTSGVAHRTVQRWLGSLEVDGVPVFPGRNTSGGGEKTKAEKLAANVKKMVSDEYTLVDILKAWHAAEGKIGRKSSVLDTLVDLGVIAAGE
jgi:hemoglobin-like flavoprotein